MQDPTNTIFPQRLDAEAVAPNRFFHYVDTFREGGTLPPMMQLKVDHTQRVVADALRIMQAENWPNDRIQEGLWAAWLHDISRFEQFLRYGTFSDRKSIDHGARSAELIAEKKLLDGIPLEVTARITEAVRVHNKKSIPPEHQGVQLDLSRLVRDADKLDILALLRHTAERGELLKNPDIFWGLPVHAPVNPTVRLAIQNRQPVDYQAITSLADFVMIQVGWSNCGLEFPATRALAAERNELEFRRQLLLELTADPTLQTLFENLSSN